MKSAPIAAARNAGFNNRSVRPLEHLLAHLDGVSGTLPKMRARCPSHASTGGTLSISESADGSVVMKCFAGCTVIDVLDAVGLELRDLFVPKSPAQARDRDEAVRRERDAYKRDPAAYLRASLRRAIGRIQDERRDKLGFYAPLRSIEVDQARRHVARTVGVHLSDVPAAIGWKLWTPGFTTRPALWEWTGHDEDPLWPSAFRSALALELKQIRAIYPDFEIRGEDDFWMMPHTLYRAAQRAGEAIAAAARSEDRPAA